VTAADSACHHWRVSRSDFSQSIAALNGKPGNGTSLADGRTNYLTVLRFDRAATFHCPTTCYSN
jgi:hypothetical protein